MNKCETMDSISEMFKQSRIASGKSQDWVAKKLGVSKKSVQNWENGMSIPNLLVTFEWFDVVGVPMYPYFMNVLHPLEIADIKPTTEEAKLRKALDVYVREMPSSLLQELLFLFFGKHGSSPNGLIDTICAYLHLPLSMRIVIAESIDTAYELCESNNLLVCNDDVKPDINRIKTFVESAKTSAKNGKQSYL